MKTDPNDSASPIQGFCCDASGALTGQTVSSRGLTKRELFAAMAMQGLVMNGESIPERLIPGDNGKTEMNVDCERAVDYADALIAALNEEAQ